VTSQKAPPEGASPRLEDELIIVSGDGFASARQRHRTGSKSNAVRQTWARTLAFSASWSRAGRLATAEVFKTVGFRRQKLTTLSAATHAAQKTNTAVLSGDVENDRFVTAFECDAAPTARFHWGSGPPANRSTRAGDRACGIAIAS
jgi:hypothetical protein